jgi:hypothetical protein
MEVLGKMGNLSFPRPARSSASSSAARARRWAARAGFGNSMLRGLEELTAEVVVARLTTRINIDV